MKLITRELLNKFPKIGETSNRKAEEVPIIAKYFCPWNKWTWYATEYDGKDLFFGFVRGDFNELGYFRLSELKSIRGMFGLGIERDLYFTKHTLKEVMEKDY